MTAPDPRVAVVIVTRDRADSLRRTLAVLRDLPERPRVVVVDNGSGDGTPGAAREAGVELVELGRNLGSAARNVGADRVDAPYVAFADDDSWWAPGALARAADLLDAHPRLALLAARVLVGPEGRLDPTCGLMAASPLPTPPDLPGPAVLGFLACGAVVRRGAFRQVGGFSERFGIGGEEELLALDLAAAGWGLAYVADVVAHHHPSPSRDPEARRRVQVRNALWCAWMRRPAVPALRRTRMLLGPWRRDRATRAGFVEALRGVVPVVWGRRPIPGDLEAQVRLLEG